NLFAGFLHQLRAWIVVLVYAMAKAHKAYTRGLVLDLFHKGTDLLDTTVGLQVLEHLQACFVSATVCRTPQAGNTCSDSGEGVSARRAAQAHGRGRGVLLVISMQNEDPVKRALDHF